MTTPTRSTQPGRFYTCPPACPCRNADHDLSPDVLDVEAAIWAAQWNDRLDGHGNPITATRPAQKGTS